MKFSELDLSKFAGEEFVDLSQYNLSDIEGIEKLGAIRGLNLSNNNLTNINPIQYLPSLRVLQLSHNKIKNVVILARLPLLEQLDISFNQVESAFILCKLTQLTLLCINNNRLISMDFVKELTNLEFMTCDIESFLKRQKDNTFTMDYSCLEPLKKLRGKMCRFFTNCPATECGKDGYCQHYWEMRMVNLLGYDHVLKQFGLRKDFIEPIDVNEEMEYIQQMMAEKGVEQYEVSKLQEPIEINGQMVNPLVVRVVK